MASNIIIIIDLFFLTQELPICSSFILQVSRILQIFSFSAIISEEILPSSPFHGIIEYDYNSFINFSLSVGSICLALD